MTFTAPNGETLTADPCPLVLRFGPTGIARLHDDPDALRVNSLSMRERLQMLALEMDRGREVVALVDEDPRLRRLLLRIEFLSECAVRIWLPDGSLIQKELIVFAVGLHV